MAQQTKGKSDRKGSKSGSKPSASKRVRQRSDGSGRNKSPRPQKEKQGSNGGERQTEVRNQGQDKTAPERMYEDYTIIDPGEISDTDEPDVIVDIPVVKVDEIHFELDDLVARISLHAEVLDLVKLSVGVHAELGKVELDIKGVEAQALLRARLDHVTAIIDRVLTTLDRNPEVLQNIAKALQPVTEGAGKAVGEVGEGANKAVGQIGEGAGSAVEDVGEGAEGAVKDVGKGAGGAVEDVGEGAGKAVGEVGEVGEGAGALGALGGGGGGNGGGEGNGGEGGSGGGIAKQIAKIVAKEIGAAASDEVKDLGLGAAHKAIELGERRRQKRAEKHNATAAALRKAEEAGVAIDEVEGTGAEGRVTVHDVEKAAAG
jgi:e3 binding domain